MPLTGFNQSSCFHNLSISAVFIGSTKHQHLFCVIKSRSLYCTIKAVAFLKQWRFCMSADRAGGHMTIWSCWVSEQPTMGAKTTTYFEAVLFRLAALFALAYYSMYIIIGLVWIIIFNLKQKCEFREFSQIDQKWFEMRAIKKQAMINP